MTSRSILDFSDLDVDALAAVFGNAKGTTKFDTLPLHPEALSELNATVDITASSLAIAGRKLRTVALDGRLAGGDVTLKELSFALGGGRLSASGTLKGKGKDGRLALRTRLAKAEIAALARELGATGDEIRGRLDAAASLTMSGRTVGAALKRSDGAAVLLMRDGQVAQSLIEQLSADLRGLFRERHDYVPVSCLLGDRDPEGRHRRDLAAAPGIARRRSRSAPARSTSCASGSISRSGPNATAPAFSRSTSRCGSAARSTESSAAPLSGSDEDWLRQPTAPALPPDLQKMATGSACRE